MEITNPKTGKSYRKDLNPVVNSSDTNILPHSAASVPVDFESIAIEVAYEEKNESSYKTDDSEVLQIRILDDSNDHIHLGHYHSFYNDDESGNYIQKVLITSGAAYIMNAALHTILDGFIWDWFGLPVFTVVIPFLTKLFLSVPSTLNPFNLLRKFWNRIFHKSGSHHFGDRFRQGKKNVGRKNSGPEKLFVGRRDARHDNQMFLPKKSDDEQKLFGFININRKKMTRVAKFGLLAWLVLRLISPLSSSSFNNNSLNLQSTDLEETRINGKQLKDELQNTFISTKVSDKRNGQSEIIINKRKKFGNNRSASNSSRKFSPFDFLKRMRKNLNLVDKINRKWKQSKLRKIMAERINMKKRELGVPHCPLRFLLEEASPP